MSTMSAQTVRLLGQALNSLDDAKSIAAMFGNILVIPVAAATSYRRVLTTDSTAASFPATVTDRDDDLLDDEGPPTGAGFIDLSQGGEFAQRGVQLCPYANSGDDGDVFSIRVYGWSRIEGISNDARWHSIMLGEVQCTISESVTGLLAFTPINSGTFYADDAVIVGTTGNVGTSIEIVAPQNGTPAHIIVDLKGSQILEVKFSTEGGGSGKASQLNALYKLI